MPLRPEPSAVTIAPDAHRTAPSGGGAHIENRINRPGRSKRKAHSQTSATDQRPGRGQRAPTPLSAPAGAMPAKRDGPSGGAHERQSGLRLQNRKPRALVGAVSETGQPRPWRRAKGRKAI